VKARAEVVGEVQILGEKLSHVEEEREKVGRCRLTSPVLKAPMNTALETIVS